MKVRTFGLIVWGLVSGLSSVAWGVNYGPDLLGGKGDLEGDNQTAWTLSSSTGEATWNTTYSLSPVTSAKLGGTANVNHRLYWNGSIATAGGRQHAIIFFSRQPASGTPSGRRVVVNSSVVLDGWLYGTGYFRRNTTSFTQPAGDNTADLYFEIRASSTHTSNYLDDIGVYREIVDPVVASLSTDTFVADSAAALSLIGTGGANATGDLIAFDPDVTVTWVSGVPVDINSVTWINDNQTDIQITAHEAGTATLQVQNPYGGMSHTFDITVESATPILTVTPESVEVADVGGWTTFTVSNANSLVRGMAWTADVIEGGDWLSIAPDNQTATGTDSGSFSVDFAPSDNKTAARTGVVRLSAPGAQGSPKDIVVTQRVHRAWGPDLLGGKGDLEGDNQTAWTLDSLTGEATWDTTYSLSPVTSAKLGGTANINHRLCWNGSIATAGGREHILVFCSRQPTSGTPSGRRVYVNSSILTTGWLYGTTYFRPNILYFTQPAGDTAADLYFEVRAGFTHSANYLDNISVQRECADPVITPKSADAFDTDVAATLSLFNTGGTTADGDLVAFDPDVTVTSVSGAAVEVNSVTWVSDNQVDVQITPHGAGTATLQVQNPYGGLAHTFDLTVRGVVSGTVTIQNFTGDYTGVPMTIAIQSSPVDSHPVTLDANGHYSFMTTRTGTFDITAKAPFTLTARATGVVLGAGPVDFTLVSGDANGDDRIGFEDFSLLQNSYGQSGKTPAEGDFNGDGQVTFEDFSILQNNYGQSGATSAASSAAAIATGGCGGLGILMFSFLGLALCLLGPRNG